MEKTLKGRERDEEHAAAPLLEKHEGVAVNVRDEPLAILAR